MRTDLSAAVNAAHRRHTGAQCSTPPEVSRGQYWSLTPHAASFVPFPHYDDHFLQHLLFFLYFPVEPTVEDVEQYRLVVFRIDASVALGDG